MIGKRVSYISGKVTGVPQNLVIEKFGRIEKLLESAGYLVINPASMIPFDMDWYEAMRTCLALLMRCDCIYLLNDWRSSRGATIERALALDMGINIISHIIDPVEISKETDANSELLYNVQTDLKPEAIEKHHKIIQKLHSLPPIEALESGVILVRPATDRMGNPIIEQRTSDKNWHTRITLTRPEMRDKMINRLILQKRVFRLETEIAV